MVYSSMQVSTHSSKQRSFTAIQEEGVYRIGSNDIINGSCFRYNKALDAKKDRSKSSQAFGAKGRGGNPNQVSCGNCMRCCTYFKICYYQKEQLTVKCR